MNSLLMFFPLRYLISIIVLSIFAVLCIIYLVYYIRLKKHEEEQQKTIYEIYTAAHGKTDYDGSAFDKETEERIMRLQEQSEGQMTIDDIIANTEDDDGTLFGSFDEGPDEITGSYKPE